MEELIDWIVDVSNTFGSLVSVLSLKYKNYNKILMQPAMTSEVTERLLLLVPEIDKEIANNAKNPKYIVMLKMSRREKRTSFLFVFLNEEHKYIHSFNLLKSNVNIDINTPCYWKVYK